MKWGFNRDTEGFLLCVRLPMVTTVINLHHDPSLFSLETFTPQTNFSVFYHGFFAPIQSMNHWRIRRVGQGCAPLQNLRGFL